MIEIKLKDYLLSFDEWKYSDPDFMWYRQIINNTDADGVSGIVLIKFNEVWAIRFFGEILWVINDYYNSMLPNIKSYSNVVQAREEIDKFLHRINSLRVFL